jgi:hypothetical protein
MALELRKFSQKIKRWLKFCGGTSGQIFPEKDFALLLYFSIGARKLCGSLLYLPMRALVPGVVFDYIERYNQLYAPPRESH